METLTASDPKGGRESLRAEYAVDQKPEMQEVPVQSGRPASPDFVSSPSVTRGVNTPIFDPVYSPSLRIGEEGRSAPADVNLSALSGTPSAGPYSLPTLSSRQKSVRFLSTRSNLGRSERDVSIHEIWASIHQLKGEFMQFQHQVEMARERDLVSERRAETFALRMGSDKALARIQEVELKLDTLSTEFSQIQDKSLSVMSSGGRKEGADDDAIDELQSEFQRLLQHNTTSFERIEDDRQKVDRVLAVLDRSVATLQRAFLDHGGPLSARSTESREVRSLRSDSLRSSTPPPGPEPEVSGLLRDVVGRVTKLEGIRRDLAEQVASIREEIASAKSVREDLKVLETSVSQLSGRRSSSVVPGKAIGDEKSKIVELEDRLCEIEDVADAAMERARTAASHSSIVEELTRRNRTIIGEYVPDPSARKHSKSKTEKNRSEHPTIGQRLGEVDLSIENLMDRMRRIETATKALGKESFAHRAQSISTVEQRISDRLEAVQNEVKDLVKKERKEMMKEMAELYGAPKVENSRPSQSVAEEIVRIRERVDEVAKTSQQSSLAAMDMMTRVSEELAVVNGKVQSLSERLPEIDSRSKSGEEAMVELRSLVSGALVRLETLELDVRNTGMSRSGSIASELEPINRSHEALVTEFTQLRSALDAHLDEYRRVQAKKRSLVNDAKEALVRIEAAPAERPLNEGTRQALVIARSVHSERGKADVRNRM